MEVHTQAFADAYGKAQARFNSQCKVLGLNAADFYVMSWTVNEDRPHGKTLSLGMNAAEPKPIGLEPGKASLDLTVSFLFAPKKPQP